MFSTDYRSRVVGHRITRIDFKTGSTVIGQLPGQPPHHRFRPHKPLWEPPKPGRLGGPIGTGSRNDDQSRRLREQARERQRAIDEKARRDREERDRKARQRSEEGARKRQLDEMARLARRSEEERRRRRDAERLAAEQRRAADRRRAAEQERARQQREREAAARRSGGGRFWNWMGKLVPDVAGIRSVLDQHAAVFRSLIDPAFDRSQAPPTLLLPDEFRAAAAHIQQASIANAIKYPPATGAPPQPVEVNRGIVIEDGILKAIPGNIGQAGSVPPVNAAPGQTLIADLHVHPGGTPLDANDITYLWEPGGPRMMGVVIGGNELGIMISTRNSEEARVKSGLRQVGARVAFERVMSAAEKAELRNSPNPTSTQRNDARHAALAAVAKQYGFVYYHGAAGAPLRRVDAARW